ncbi:MAG: Dam family site-specific DNA-(adenine-N6)-methyltransferase [Bacteroidota bacterium]
MKIPHPIPYQGSKRNLAKQILRFFPNNVDRLVEPFAGSAAMSIASAYHTKAEAFWINDINEPLIHLWEKIINNSELLAEQYRDIWLGQMGREEEYYYEIRQLFNETQQAEYLLFLLAKCVKAAVRYNSNGVFNQSPDKRRKGRRPENMKSDILRVSQLLHEKSKLTSLHYEDLLDDLKEDDLVYLDPPYQGTGKKGGFRYFRDVKYENFITFLFQLNGKEIPFILSYDGRTGDKVFGQPLPEELNLTKVEIDAGRSSTATLHNRKQNTFESLYISECLAKRISIEEILNPKLIAAPTLFDCYG